MKMKKIFAAFLAAASMATLFAGCQTQDGDGMENTDTAAAAEDNSLDSIKEKGKFILGLDDSFPPMGFRDENNEIVGFDIDLAKEVASRMGVELVVQPISWDSKEMELNSGNIDCIWNGMSINDDRKEAMNLSEAYLRNDMVFVVLDSSAYNSQADLAGKKVAVQNGSSAQEILEGSEFNGQAGEIIGYDDNVTAFMDLDANGVDAVFLDSVVANYFITSKSKPYRILSDVLYEEEYAIGFRKNDQALRDEVQKILSEMKADGKVGEISTKWFGSDITIIE
ncbi:MAG: amino acid ABC transporter substrate-binding protein [Oscillospiraceae bacterium]|nr:amino acid ABC transporter substrate-binding protein [Oscillospiraceae bacterium]